jgi:alkane 1-monooxygenase
MPLIARYAIVTLTPLALLLLGATAWGGFAVMALVWLTLVAALLDGLLAPPAPDDADHAPWSNRLSVTLAAGHLLLLPLVLVALAAPGLGIGQKIALFFATASFMGQVSHPNAHELIHRREPWLRRLGAAVYVSVGFGHHVSAHRLVHHRHVGTPDDPNTPLPGESFWGYLPRAWREGFHAGLDCEEDRLEAQGLPPRHWRNPYWAWVGGTVLALILAALIAGPVGLLAYLGLVVLSGGQILMSDYVQHYGLQRLELPSGRREPVGPHHSWNAPRGFSSYLMMNAPAHSEHHLHPDRPYDRLTARAEGPILPWSLPVMAMLATIPPVWHRVMDRRALKVMEAVEARIAAGEIGQTPEPAAPAVAPSVPEETETQASPTPPPRAGAAPLPPVETASDDAALIARVQGMLQ